MRAAPVVELRHLLLDRVNEMSDSCELRALSLELIAKIVPADGAHFVPFNRDFIRVVPPHLRSIGEDRRYQEGLLPAFSQASAGPERGAFVDSESFTEQEKNRLSVYR